MFGILIATLGETFTFIFSTSTLEVLPTTITINYLTYQRLELFLTSVRFSTEAIASAVLICFNCGKTIVHMINKMQTGGLREREREKKKKKNKFSIIALG